MKKAIKKMSFKELINEHKKLVKDLEGSKNQYNEQKKELDQYLREYAKVKGYAKGGDVSEQSPEEAGIEAKARREDVLRNAGISPNQSPEEIEIEAAEKRKRELEKKDESKANGPRKYTDGGQVQESQQKQYQAKDYFGKGSNAGNSPATSNAQGVAMTMSEGGWADLAAKIREAFKTPPAPKPQKETQDEKYERIRKENQERAMGKRPSLESMDSDYNSETQYKADGGKIEPSAIDKEIEEHRKMIQTLGSEPFVSNPNAAIVREKYEQALKNAYMEKHKQEGYSDGGSVSANTVSSLSPLLKQTYAGSLKKKKKNYDEGGEVEDSDIIYPEPDDDEDDIMTAKLSAGGWTPEQVMKAPKPLKLPGVHAPTEKKYPLNIERAPRLRIPKRLKSLSFIKGYDDGGGVQKMDLGDLPMQVEGLPYDYNAEDKAAQPPLSNQELLSQIDDALGSENKSPEQEQPSQSPRKLEGMTLSKDEALKENPEDEDAKLVNTLGKEDTEATKVSDATTAGQLAKEDMGEEQPSEEQRTPQANVEPPSYDPIKALEDAQKARNRGQLFNQLGAISERTAAQMGGFKPIHQETYKENMAIAQQAVDDVKDRIKQQGDDPNSQISKTFKQYLEKFSGHPVDPNTTANAGKEILPLVFKDFEAKLANQTRKDLLAEKLAERTQEGQLRREAEEKKYKYLSEERKGLAEERAKDREAASQLKTEEKQDQFDRKRLDNLGKLLTSETASSRSAFGRGANNVRSAEAIEALADQFKGRLDQMDERQVTELARSMDALLSNGQPTISGTQSLVPKTAVGNIAKMVEYLRNIPVGQQQSAFVKRMLETVGREKELAKEQIKRAQGKILGPYKETLRRRPDDARDILEPHGLEFLLNPEEKQEAKPSEQPNKKVVRKGYNAKTNQTQFIYDDGTSEIKEGRL